MLEPLFQKHTSCLGVINITPDSFSDAGKWMNHSHWQEIIPLWRSLGVRFFDIGAQSTAPNSCLCTPEEEWGRLEEFFFCQLDLFKPGDTISLDTFRVGVFEKFYQRIRQERPDIKIIFNDVSGVLDDEILNCLTEYTDFQYVFSHNLSPLRESSCDHMNYVEDHQTDNILFLQKLLTYFRKAEQEFLKRELLDRVIFDPCFGFSKNFRQNIYLLQNIEQVFRSFPKSNWLIGISKKSFLQYFQPASFSKQQKRESSEFLHSNLVAQILLKWRGHTKLASLLSGKSPPHLFVRVHDPLVYRNSALYVQKFF